MSRSYVVTGGGRSLGRAIVERLLDDAGEKSVSPPPSSPAGASGSKHLL